MSEFAKTLQRSSDLVKRWGGERPAGRASTRALLALGQISVWDIMAPDLALYRIPKGLQGQPQRKSFRQVLARYFRPLKYALRRNRRLDDSDCARWPSGRTALFMGFTPYIARDVLLPVVDMLQNRIEVTPVLLVDDRESLRSDKAPLTHSVHRHLGRETSVAARELAKGIRHACSILTQDPAYHQLFADEDRHLWPTIGEEVRGAFNGYASFVLPDVMAVARHILTVHRPSIIVSPDVADPRTRVYTLLGHALGIPTMEVQFGACGPDSIEWRFFEADIAVAWGQDSWNALRAHGVPVEKVQVTGSPRHDALFGVTSSEIGALRQRFAVPSENRTVLFGSSYFLAAYENATEIALMRSMKKSVLAAAAATPGVSLIVKPHPLENVSELRKLVAKDSRVAFAAPGEDIRALTRACDAFFTLGSASTLDALILGKPTVCPAFTGWHFSELFTQSGAVLVPRSERDVLKAMGEIGVDGGADIVRRHASRRSEFLASWVRDGGQGATRRIADLIAEIALGVTQEHQ